MEFSKAKFQLGKIVNKYLIIDILAFTCDCPSEIFTLLHTSSKSLRHLCSANYFTIKNSYSHKIKPFLMVGRTNYDVFSTVLLPSFKPLSFHARALEEFSSGLDQLLKLNVEQQQKCKMVVDIFWGYSKRDGSEYLSNENT